MHAKLPFNVLSNLAILVHLTLELLSIISKWFFLAFTVGNLAFCESQEVTEGHEKGKLNNSSIYVKVTCSLPGYTLKGKTEKVKIVDERVNFPEKLKVSTFGRFVLFKLLTWFHCILCYNHISNFSKIILDMSELKNLLEDTLMLRGDLQYLKEMSCTARVDQTLANYTMHHRLPYKKTAYGNTISFLFYFPWSLYGKSVSHKLVRPVNEINGTLYGHSMFLCYSIMAFYETPVFALWHHMEVMFLHYGILWNSRFRIMASYITRVFFSLWHTMNLMFIFNFTFS